MNDIKTKVESWANSALSLNKDTPDDSIVEILKPFIEELNEDVIKRVVETYNVRNFLDRQTQGEDMEESFPLANSELVYAKLFKDTLKDSIKLDEPEELSELPDFTEVKQASAKMPTRNEVTRLYREDAFQSNLIGTLESSFRKCAEFIQKFDEYYSKNVEFLKELRYMYPNSQILKSAGLLGGAKKIPDCITITHSEFGTIEKMMEKISKKKIMNKSAISVLDPNNPEIQKIQDEYAHQEALKKITPDIQKQRVFELRDKLTDTKLEDLQNQFVADNADEADEWAQKKELEKLRKTYLPPSLLDRFNTGAEKLQKGVSKTYNNITAPLRGASKVIRDAYGAVKAPFSAVESVGKDVGDLYKNIVTQSLGLVPSYNTENLEKQIARFNPLQNLFEIIKNDDIDEEFRDNTNKMIDILTYKNNFESVVKNDPALKGADPNILLNIYKTTVSLAPTLMKNKEVVRSILRSANSIGTGGLDPETALTLSKIEGNLYTIKNKTIGKYLGYGKEDEK